MSEAYNELRFVPPEALNRIGEAFDVLKSGVDTIYNLAKTNILVAKALAAGANPALAALKTALDEIIEEIERLKGGTFSGILAHPHAYRIRTVYDRKTGTMTLTPESALTQIKEAFDDKGDIHAPVKNLEYSGLVVVGVAPDIQVFAEIVKSLGDFFSVQELKDLEKQIQERFESGAETFLSDGLDFFGFPMEDFLPEYIAVLDEIKSVAEGIRSGIVGITGSLDDMIEYLDKKLQQMAGIAARISAVLDKFAIELSSTGVAYKKFEDSPTDTIKTELLTGTPEGWKEMNYAVVIGIFDVSGSLQLVFDVLSLD